MARSRSATLTDVSCSGATTADMTAPQADGVPAQLDAPETPAAPVHPNATGESVMAAAVEGVLTRHGRHH
ncbi:hypothetical protein [Streptomyces sp. NPDC059862]|uniref:hypothetical protein n=1 Tax=unclassified Streptomyces TaxID=2593676 RepID=UPI0036328964